MGERVTGVGTAVDGGGGVGGGFSGLGDDGDEVKGEGVMGETGGYIVSSPFLAYSATAMANEAMASTVLATNPTFCSHALEK